MRPTEDGHIVSNTDQVYEIIYQYINPEVSVPVSNRTEVSKIPQGTKIWVHESNCSHAINKMQKQKTKS